MNWRDNSLSIIIPAYNEEKRIGATLKDYLHYFSKKRKKFEIIVVTDGCIDKTVGIVKSFKSKHVKNLNYGKKLGKGSAILKGFENANGNIIGFVDADESVKPEDFHKMALLIGEYECVVASRRTEDSKILTKQPIRRRALGRGYNIMVNLLFGLRIKDTQCGAKVFTKNAIKTILAEVGTKGYSFDVEILWRLRRRKFKIKEYPVTWMHMKEGAFNVRKHAFKMLIEIMKLRFLQKTDC